MSSAPLPDNERERLLALYECDILDTSRDPLFDSLTTLAAQVCDAPIALFSLIDRERQWFKSNHGLPGTRQTSRGIAFCAHTILSDEMLEVPDAARGARSRGARDSRARAAARAKDGGLRNPSRTKRPTRNRAHRAGVRPRKSGSADPTRPVDFSRT